MAKMQKKEKYPDALAHPIRPIIGGLLVQLPDSDYRRYVVGSWQKKMDLLLEHYHLKDDDPERWQKLSFRLALDHIVGMQVSDELPRKHGAPRKRDSAHSIKYLNLIDEIATERQRGILDAIRIAQRRKLASGSVRSLERRYYDLRSRFQSVRGRESPVFQKLTDVYDISALPERAVKKRADVPLRFREIGSGIRQVTLEEYQYLISLRKLDDAFYCSEFDRMTRGRPAQFGRNRPKRFGAMRRDANDRSTPTLHHSSGLRHCKHR